MAQWLNLLSNTRKALDSIPITENKMNGHSYKSVANTGEEKTLVVITGTCVSRKKRVLPTPNAAWWCEPDVPHAWPTVWEFSSRLLICLTLELFWLILLKMVARATVKGQVSVITNERLSTGKQYKPRRLCAFSQLVNADLLALPIRYLDRMSLCILLL